MRKKRLFLTASIATGVLCLPAHAGAIDGGLEQVLHAAEEGEVISALVFLWDQGDIDALAAEHRAERVPFARRNEEVVRTLRDTAEVTQARLRQELAVRRDQGTVATFEPYWIANVIRVDATEQVLRELAEHPDVQRIYYNMPIEGIGAVEQDDQNAVPLGDGPPPGIVAVRAPEVWNLGYTGNGVLIASMDTGVDGEHPALADRWRGLDPAYDGNPQWAWFDPITNTTFPEEFDFGSHGTHTMGTILGGAPGEQIGVAPDAQWIHAGVIDRGGIDATIANAIASFQWMASPTGNPADTWAVPRVCSNSWGTVAVHGHPQCDETFWVWIDNSEAAGTAQVFAAGNESSAGLRRPADRALNDYHSMAVGSIDPHDPSWPVSNFSSIGPTQCTLDGSTAIKPDIAAPGSGIRSSVSGGGYTSYGGTSMAAPHVNGVLALMIEACDFLTSDELKQIIYDTAHDLGSPGKNNTYGYGMIDALAAVERVLELCTIGVSLPDGPLALVDPGADNSFLVQVVEGNESPVPGSELLYYSVNGSAFQTTAMTYLGNGLYEATIPAATCDEVIDYYIELTGDGGTVRRMPEDAPDSLYTAHVGQIVTDMVLEQNFDAGLPDGWSASGLWNMTSACEVSGECPESQWAYYGNPETCLYETGNAPNDGELISLAIDIPEAPPLASITVSFCYNLETEPAEFFDVATFSVVGGDLHILQDSSQWTTFSADITQYAGETITLSWFFDTIDGVANNYRGWQVDNVQVAISGLQCDPAPACPSDFNGDGTVDVADLLILLAAWGACDGCGEDLNGDGVVDVADMLILLSDWGSCD